MDIDVTTQARFKVGFLLIDGFALMSYSSAGEPLRAANLLINNAYEMTHICLTGEGAHSSGGAVIPALALGQTTMRFDLIWW